MLRDATLFQYCQKIILMRKSDTEVLLARRTGEQDYNQTYSFIGGKAETTDSSILNALRREKDQEIGTAVRVRICPLISYNVYFIKKDGNHMIVPHYYAEYVSGEITLNSEEYDDYQWVSISDLPSFEPKVSNIPELTAWAVRQKTLLKSEDMVEI